MHDFANLRLSLLSVGGQLLFMAALLSAADNGRLPDPLTTSTGQKVTAVLEWRKLQRPQIPELFRTPTLFH
jgi:hypothetical protein